MKKIQDWSKKDKKALLDFLAKIEPDYNDIAIVGSRIRDDFTDRSDLDVIIYTEKERGNYHTYYKKMQVCVYFQPPKDFHRKVYGGMFHLPLYSLANDYYFEGKSGDIEKYKKWKHGIR